jgi:ABC-2 type transport system ATP-binding protein
MISIIKTVGLSHKYGSSWAIRDINIDIGRKGIYGLLGSNGAGKSTTMNIICGALNQTQGEVFINGINVQKNPLEAKKSLGYLPQQAPLYLDLTITEYLRYCANLKDIEKKAIPTAIDEVMEKFSITHMKDRVLKNLSGGYRQRVGFAQAVIHKPKVVILDEPANGLDPVQIAEMRNLIKEISHERTVILSSHILQEIQAVCDEIIMIEQGQLVFADSIEAFNNYVAPQSIILVFENPPAIDSLSIIPGISRVEKISSKSFRVFYGGNNKINEAIIAESVRNEWRLIELMVEKNSVDEIFKEITKKATKRK